MLFKAIASVLMSNVLKSAQKDIVETAQKQLASAQLKQAQIELNRQIAEKYAEEVKHNVSEYIKALESANVEIEFKGKPGEAFINRAQAAVTELENYLDKQNPDGPIIKFLKKRYKEEGINIITGRLYAGHYVKRKGQGTFEIMNTMGYASDVDKRKPWLSGSATKDGIEEILSDAAKEIFEVMFEDVDFSKEAAELRFFGSASSDIISKSSPSGEGFGSQQNKKRSSKPKRKR